MQYIYFVYQYNDDMTEVTCIAHFISENQAYRYWQIVPKYNTHGWHGPVRPRKMPIGATISYTELEKLIREVQE